jgi:hypothetical protein
MNALGDTDHYYNIRHIRGWKLLCDHLGLSCCIHLREPKSFVVCVRLGLQSTAMSTGSILNDDLLLEPSGSSIPSL